MATSPKESSQIKSKERVAEHGEVFTAEREVNAMLDLVANECLRPGQLLIKMRIQVYQSHQAKK